MATKTVSRSFTPLLLIFIVTNALFIFGRPLFTPWNLDVNVLLAGNAVLFAAAGISFYLFTRSANSKNAQAIVRSVYSGVLAKMMICMFAAFLYISIAGKAVNKGGLLGCMALYLLYTFTEVAILMKLSKQKTNV
jgi:hypothetical protein